MFKMLSVRTYAFMAFALFILWFPKDWEDRGDAVSVWQRWLSVIDRETLLWAFSLVLLAWLVWTDIRPWWRTRRTPPNWWKGLQSFSLKSAGCLVAGVSDKEFVSSDRAQAVANEIRGYVNSGHMPTMLEKRNPRPDDYGGPGYATKLVGYDAQILRSDLERIALSRGWYLPWEITPKPKQVMVPLKSPNALLSLIDIAQKKQP